LSALHGPDDGAHGGVGGDVEVEGVDVLAVHVVPEGEAGGLGSVGQGWANQLGFRVEVARGRFDVDVVAL
jgi:hypothetical protein